MITYWKGAGASLSHCALIAILLCSLRHLSCFNPNKLTLLAFLEMEGGKKDEEKSQKVRSKRGGSSRDAPACMELPQPKRLKGTDHDVTVIVGDQTFHHYSSVLRLASEYFDIMLTQSMREGNEKIVRFPTLDPAEWSLVYQFLDPSTSRFAKITIQNVVMLIPWFHLFQMDNLLAECDKVFARLVSDCKNKILMHADRRELKKARACIVHLLDKVDLSIMYSLSHSLSQGVRVLKKVTEQMWLCDMKICSRLLQIAEDSMMARESLWPRLLCILPTKHLWLASVEDIVNNSFSRDLFVAYLGNQGESIATKCLLSS